LDVSNGGIFSGDMVTPQQRIGSMLTTSVTRTRNLSNPLVAQQIVGSNLGSNLGSMNNSNNLGSNGSNLGSNINNLGSNLGSISNNGSYNNGGTNLRHQLNLPHAKYLGMCKRYLAKINMPSIEDIKYKGITYNFNPKDLTPDLYLPNNSQDILALYEWGKKVIIYLNPYGDALQIWQDNGRWNWEVKVSADMLATFINAQGFEDNFLFDQARMDKLFWYCCKKHVQLCMPNYNKWCSVMFLFNFLVKAAEFVPILSQQYLQLTLNDVASAVQLILDFYREMPGPQIYARAMQFNTLKPEPGWSIRVFLSVEYFAIKEAEVLQQLVEMQLQKYVYFRAQQLIFSKKYYKEMNKWFTDTTITLPNLVTNHEALIAEEQEVDLNLQYNGGKHADNQYAIQLFLKMKQHGSVKASANLVADFNLEANSAMVIKPRYCTRPGCRKNRRFANHLAENCFFDPTSAHNKLRNNFQGPPGNSIFRNQQFTNRSNNYMGNSGNNRVSNIINSGFKPSGKTFNKNFQQITNNNGPSQRTGSNGNIRNNYNSNNVRQQNPTFSTNNAINHHNNNNKVTNSFGNRFNNNSKLVSPNVKNALSALNRDNSKDGRFLRNAVQKAMVVEKAAANFVQSGDLGTMKQTLKRAFDTPSSHRNQPQKVGRGNMPHKNNQVFTAESTSKSIQQNVQSCRHCGKNVIHTDGICDVYRTSTIRDSTIGQQANLVDNNNHKVLFDGTNFRDCAYGFFMDFEDVDDLFVDMYDSDDEEFLPPLPSLPVDELLFNDPTHDSRFAEIFANTQMHMLDFDAYTDRDGTIRSADVALQHTQQLQYVHDGLRLQLRAHLQLTSQEVPDNHILEVYGRLYMVPLNVRDYLCHSDWTAFQGLRTSMWYQRFPMSEDINLMTLMIDNGVLHQIIPFPEQPRDNSWFYEQRCVPDYRPYYGRRTAFGFDVDDIFDIGITFTHGKPIMGVFTDLIVTFEEQKQDNIPTPINLSIIMEEEETKVEQIFDVDPDNDTNLDDTLSIDLIVCPSCNRQCTLEDQEDGLCCQPHLYCNLHSVERGF